MSLYFFDVHNSVSFVDDVGSDHADLQSVRHEVRRSLVEIAHSYVGEKDALQLRVDVRDTAGKRIMTAALMIIVEEAA